MNEPVVKTSDTSPIRVDFVAGRPLGLTFAPGKHGESKVGAYRWARDLTTDIERLREHYAVDCIFTLVEEHELELLQIPSLRDAIRAGGMTSHWYPIPDGGVPAEMGPFVATIRTIRSAMRGGERVVLHCRGGLGRAGTVAACVLVSLGEPADDAIEHVRAARHGAIENEMQEEFVARFEQFWHR